MQVCIKETEMAHWKTSSLFVAASLVVVGCGGLSDDTRLADLEDDDLVALCEETYDEPFEPTREQACALGAHLTPTVTNSEECEAVVEACLEMDEQPGEEEEVNCAEAKAPSAACEATVGDVRTCARSTMDALRALYDRANCSTIESDRITLSDLSLDVAESAACQAISDRSCNDD